MESKITDFDLSSKDDKIAYLLGGHKSFGLMNLDGKREQEVELDFVPSNVRFIPHKSDQVLVLGSETSELEVWNIKGSNKVFNTKID